GRQVVVGTGTYRYNGAPRWRAWFRSTAAHNTVEVGGLDQSVQRGDWTWASRANAFTDEVDLDAGRVRARHDGYVARLGVLHRREVAITASGVELIDTLEGSGSVEVSVAFHL